MTNWKKSVLHGVAAMAISAGIAPFAATAAGAADVRTIDVQQGKTMKEQGALLLDVREPYEYEEAHVPGSVLVPLGQLKGRLQEIRALGKPVAVICRSGNRSAVAAGQLQQAGLSDVYNVQGGMLAWERAGLPVKQGRK